MTTAFIDIAKLGADEREPSPSMGEGWVGVRAPTSISRTPEARLSGKALARPLGSRSAYTPIPSPSPIEGEGGCLRGAA